MTRAMAALQMQTSRGQETRQAALTRRPSLSAQQQLQQQQPALAAAWRRCAAALGRPPWLRATSASWPMCQASLIPRRQRSWECPRDR
jgi:hypothetical protein